MTVSNPTSGERDLDALRRAQRAHEPSMEEILASIRSIIADDREPAAPRPAAKPASAPSGPQIVYSKDEPARAQAAEPPPPVEAPTPKVVWSQPQLAESAAPPATSAPFAPPAAAAKPEPAPAPAAKSEPVPAAKPESAAGAAVADETPLLSDQADHAVSAAFEALSTSLAMQSSALAEKAAREILRPMLKAWLDENLPAMVERLVRAEIQRVARGGR